MSCPTPAAGFASDPAAARIQVAHPRLSMARSLVDEVVAQATANPSKAPPTR